MLHLTRMAEMRWEWKIDRKRVGQSLLITVGIRLPTQHFHVVCLSPEPVVGHTLYNVRKILNLISLL